MQMKKKLKEEKASMAVYVSIVLLSFLILLSSMYATSVSVRKSQLKTVMRIKQSYEVYNANAEEIYQEQLRKLQAQTAQ